MSRKRSRSAVRHLVVELQGAQRLDDLGHVEETLRRFIEASGATLEGLHLHPLKPTGGVTGVAVLAESHIAIHTWPRDGYAALDVFMDTGADPERALPLLAEAFVAGEVSVKTRSKGDTRSRPRPAAAVPIRASRKAKVAA